MAFTKTYVPVETSIYRVSGKTTIRDNRRINGKLTASNLRFRGGNYGDFGYFVYFCNRILNELQAMPKIYEYLGIIFFLYPNDHEPIHAHAISGEYETIFEFHFENGQLKEIKTRKKRGKEHLPKAKMEQAKAFVEQFAIQIAEKWYRFYILKETLTCEKINKKI